MFVVVVRRLLVLGLTLMWSTAAHAVANLEISITNAGDPVPGATITLVALDGTETTATDDDNDGIIVLIPSGSSGLHQVRITVGGKTTSSMVTVPPSGTVQVSMADGHIQVGQRPGPAVAMNDASQWAAGVVAAYKMSNWDPDYDGLPSGYTLQDDDLSAASIGGDLRYSPAGYPLWLIGRLLYIDGGDATGQIIPSGGSGDGHLLTVEENWRLQILGMYDVTTIAAFHLAILVGLSFDQLDLAIRDVTFGSGSGYGSGSGSTKRTSDSSIEVSPIFGIEGRTTLANNVSLVLGANATVMSAVKVRDPLGSGSGSGSGYGSGSGSYSPNFIMDPGVQMAIYLGLSIPF